MKNVMSVIGTGALMMASGYGIYSYISNNKNMMMKKLKKASKVTSPYTNMK